jgi:hypothetical protein
VPAKGFGRAFEELLVWAKDAVAVGDGANRTWGGNFPHVVGVCRQNSRQAERENKYEATLWFSTQQRPRPHCLVERSARLRWSSVR